jgi:hypothetical protein
MVLGRNVVVVSAGSKFKFEKTNGSVQNEISGGCWARYKRGGNVGEVWCGFAVGISDGRVRVWFGVQDSEARI